MFVTLMRLKRGSEHGWHNAAISCLYLNLTPINSESFNVTVDARIFHLDVNSTVENMRPCMPTIKARTARRGRARPSVCVKCQSLLCSRLFIEWRAVVGDLHHLGKITETIVMRRCQE